MMLGKLKSMMKKQGDPNGIADVMVYFDQLAYMGRLIEQGMLLSLLLFYVC